MNGLPRHVETWGRDLRYAGRRLRSSPGFALAAVLTLGLAIGANTAVFSIVDSMLFRPLPYPEPDRLAALEMTLRSSAGEGSRLSHDGRTWERIRDHSEDIDAAVYSDWVAGVNLVADGDPAHVRQQRVGAGFFDVLGVPLRLGRDFTPEEDRPEGPAVAVLSHGLWQRLFRGDPGVLGESILLRGRSHTVVGVTSADFWNRWDAEVWTPLRPSTTGEGSGTNYRILARLQPGTSWPEAQARIGGIGERIDEEREGGDVTVGLSLVSLQEGLAQNAELPLLVLSGAVALVLLIACVNLAGLLVARSGRRTREIATHMALGGGRRAMTRQLLAESVVLGLAGGAAGVLVGTAGLRLLKSLGREALQNAFFAWQPVVLDLRVLAATAGLSLLTAVLFGLAPALQASRLDIQTALVEGDGRGVAGRRSRWSRRALVVGQVALGVVLLVAAGLLLRTLLHLQSLDPGFEPEGLITARASLADARYEGPEDVARLFEDSLERMRRTPGVESAAASLGLPYERLLNLPFRLGGEREITVATYVTPGYFEALRIPVLGGRPIGEWDRADTAPVAVVSESFVDRYVADGGDGGGGAALERQIGIAGAERRIVGVVGDVQQRPSFGDFGPLAPMPTVYFPVSQTSAEFLDLVHQWFTPAWILRSPRRSTGLASTIREAVAATDPLLPVTDIQELGEVRSSSLQQQRFLATLVTTLAVAALLLAAVGIHALIASSVTERTRELGIRMAMGATSREAMRTAMLPGVVLTAVGIGIGGVLSLGAARVLRAFVWGVNTTDPVTFVAVGGTLLAVAGLASLLPSLRILRMDPARTLREE